MQVAIFIFYLIFFSFLVSIIPFFKASGIGRFSLVALFIIKVCAGVAYAKFYTLPKYYSGSDTWRFYRISLDETKWLLHNPLDFLKDIITSPYAESANFFTGQNSYWNDLKSNIIIKLMAIINVVTNNSYYADIIFFNFLFLFGLVALFRIFHDISPDKRIFIIAGVFLLPSTLFWCSGIHKDGLILSALGLIIYAFYRGFESKFTVGKVSVILLCMLLIFTLRNSVFFALVLSLSGWWMCEKYKRKNSIIFTSIYIAAIILGIIISSIYPPINIFSFIANKQHEFSLLEGGSKVNTPQLLPTLKSFISFIPNAVDMAFLRPHVNEVKNLSYIPAIIENLFFLSLLVVSIAKAKRETKAEPVILSLFFFSVSIMLLTGFTIPFTGAMVRYRSLILPLLITPLVCNSSFILNRKKG